MHAPLNLVSILATALAVLASAVPAWAGDSEGTPQADASYLAELQAEADRHRLHETRMWTLLGHYRPRWVAGVKSDVDGRGFFLSPEGKTNPRAELQDTLAAFFEPTPDDPELQNFQCAFRARYQWLRDTLQFDPVRLPPAPCPIYDKWRQTLRPQSITVVFAAAYLNNPASMFGHTFLRLDRKKRGSGTDLLAYVVNFAAEPTTTNELFYVILGSTGGFPGRFSTVPYYLKVREYNDIESRDLWEYELNLTPAEVDRVVAHLWEIGPHEMDYFYFDENCSFQLLSILEVGRPSLRLTAAFHDVVIPPDTVKAALDNAGFVASRTYRPSNYAVMLARRDLLTDAEVEVARALGDGDDVTAALEGHAPERQALVLDAAIALHRYSVGPEPPDEDKKWGRALLIRRGKLGIKTGPPAVAEPSPVEEGHASHGLGLAAGVDSSGSLVVATLQPSLHEVVAPQRGFAPNSEIRFFATSVSISDGDNRLGLERLDVLRIQSIVPIDPWDPGFSWRLNTGILRARENGCLGAKCLYAGFGGGPGLAVGLGDQVLYTFVDAEVAYGPAWKDDWGAGLGASGGLILQMGDVVRVVTEAGVTFDLDGGGLPASPVPGDVDGPRVHVDSTLGIRLSKDAELRLTYAQRRAYRSGLFGIVLYR